MTTDQLDRRRSTIEHSGGTNKGAIAVADVRPPPGTGRSEASFVLDGICACAIAIRFAAPMLHDETLAGGSQDSLATPGLERLPARHRVDRYVIVDVIGAGGMGVVYSAYDPKLDRKTAIKILRPHLQTAATRGATRLLREAQALAQLSHPNVVAIHDVGTCEGEVWIAMELVVGTTLTDWLAQRRRTWREVLTVLRPVALALAAAHDAGLVHRDVKPANVMIGEDGRVRVMDFGLARAQTSEPSAMPSAEERDESQSSPLHAIVTRVGAMPGTPAYMAPEQISGAAIDGRSDQFSYCVMMWEAIYGERPFVADSLVELAADILQGKRRAAPRDVKVPRWLHRVVRRGLSTDPDHRFASMLALLSAIDRGRTRSRLTIGLAGVGIVALLGGGVIGTQALAQHRRIAACEATGATIDEVWSEAQRDATRAGILSSGAGHATTTAERIMPWIDAYAQAWKRARTDACLDVEVRAVWDADLLDRSVWCLDGRRLDLHALVQELSTADPSAVSRAIAAAASLPQIEACRDAALLMRLPAPPDRAREEVQSIRSELARAEAHDKTGAYPEGLAIAETALRRADDLGWPPLQVSGRARVGKLLVKTNAFAQAEAMLQSAYFDAVAVGATEEGYAAAVDLASLLGTRLARVADAEQWLRHADTLRAILPDPAGLREATSVDMAAALRQQAGDYREAIRLHEIAIERFEQALGPEHPRVATALGNLAIARELSGAFHEAVKIQNRVLAIRQATFGPDHPEVAKTLTNLANAYFEAGDRGTAATLHVRALAIREQAFGPDHLQVGSGLANLGNIRYEMGDIAEAAALQERAVAIFERSLGPDHPDLAMALSNLANVRHGMRAHADAAALYERALAIMESGRGPDHPHVAMVLHNLGNVYRALGRFEEAGVALARALDIWRRTTAPDHPDVAMAMDALGNVHYAMGDLAAAATLHEDSLAIRQARRGPDHPDLATPLVGLARARLAQHRAADAREAAERAVALREHGGVAPAKLADARFVLAQALMQTRDRDRARALAIIARDALREIDEHDPMVEEIDVWLRDQPRSRTIAASR